MDTLLVERTNGVTVITLNRPDKLNAINSILLAELETVLLEVRDNPAVRCVVITGAGEKAFAAGADIAELHSESEETGALFAQRGQRVFTLIEQLGKPVIAAINGFALGGGCELALACQLRFASSKARMGLPEVSLGIIPGYGGTQRMPKIIGTAKALEFMLSCEMIDASKALQLGLVNRVVEPGALVEETKTFAAMIASRPRLAVAGVLAAVANAATVDTVSGQQTEADIFGKLCGTNDFSEGTLAFLEKREAQFTGS